MGSLWWHLFTHIFPIPSGQNKKASMQSLFWWWPRTKHLMWTKGICHSILSNFLPKGLSHPKGLECSRRMLGKHPTQSRLGMNHDFTRPLTPNKVQQTIISLPRRKPLRGQTPNEILPKHYTSHNTHILQGFQKYSKTRQHALKPLQRRNSIHPKIWRPFQHRQLTPHHPF